MSIQGDHLHLIVEAEDRVALSRGMQGFMISCAKQINSEILDADGNRRRGRVFADRYHGHILRTPAEVRNAIRYVLNNWRRHCPDAAASGRLLDPFATGIQFDGWLERLPRVMPWPEDGVLFVLAPRTWLLKTGWRQHGLVGVTEVPG